MREVSTLVKYVWSTYCILLQAGSWHHICKTCFTLIPSQWRTFHPVGFKVANNQLVTVEIILSIGYEVFWNWLVAFQNNFKFLYCSENAVILCKLKICWIGYFTYMYDVNLNTWIWETIRHVSAPVSFALNNFPKYNLEYMLRFLGLWLTLIFLFIWLRCKNFSTV